MPPGKNGAKWIISIHSPRMGRDFDSLDDIKDKAISIHSPRMGRDQHWHQHGPIWMPFQSTLPAWGETVLLLF